LLCLGLTSPLALAQQTSSPPSDQLERLSPESLRAEFGSQMVPDAPALGGVKQVSPQVPKDTGITETTLDVPQLKGLSGSAEFSLIDVKAEPIGTKIFSDCRGSKFECIRVKIVNNGTSGLIVEAMETILVLNSAKGEARLQAVPLSTVLKGSGCGVSIAKKMLEATVGITSIGLANTIFQEIMEPHKNLGVPLGPDAIRWRLEDVALERRLIMPKDETLGLLFFAKRDIQAAKVSQAFKTSQDDLAQAKLLLPVQSLAPQPASGQIQIDLGKIAQ
jgi:hypothetical protein